MQLTYAGRTPKPRQDVCKWETEHQAKKPALLLQKDAGQACQVGRGQATLSIPLLSLLSSSEKR